MCTCRIFVKQSDIKFCMVNFTSNRRVAGKIYQFGIYKYFVSSL